ncbi:MAG: hypothetical protein ACLR8Y_01735 [Alistipes indistinctus]
MQPASQNDTLTISAELFGFIVLKADSKPHFFAGESILKQSIPQRARVEQSFDLKRPAKAFGVR